MNSLLIIGLTLALALPASPAQAVTVSEPYLVADFYTQDTKSAGPHHMTGVGDTLFFTVEYKRPYREVLWKSDGTTAGTVPVAGMTSGFEEFEDPVAFGSGGKGRLGRLHHVRRRL